MEEIEHETERQAHRRRTRAIFWGAVGVLYVAILTLSVLLGAVGWAMSAEALRERRRDYEARISPSWEERLERRDEERACEDREDDRRRDREWERLTEEEECEDEDLQEH